jgi:hypothetical protein
VESKRKIERNALRRKRADNQELLIVAVLGERGLAKNARKKRFM